jgi:hypothetical protein
MVTSIKHHIIGFNDDMYYTCSLMIDIIIPYIIFYYIKVISRETTR